MLIERQNIKLEPDEDGVWVASSDLLPGCVSWGSSEPDAILNFQEAVRAHLEVLKDTGRPVPEAFRSRFVLVA